MSSYSYSSFDKRSIIIVGHTGGGKSYLLNKLIDENIFISSADTQSCTDKVISSEWRRVKFKNGNREIYFDLNAFDTPGIGDSKGRSKQFLNDIARTIKSTPLNLIIVMVEYGKHDTNVYNTLEVLGECLQGVNRYSSMLVVNKVPTLKILEKKRKKGEQVSNRDTELRLTYDLVSRVIGISFKHEIFIENDDSEENINYEKYNMIRKEIFMCDSHLDASKVRTWNEIYNFYSSNDRNRNKDKLVRLENALINPSQIEI